MTELGKRTLKGGKKTSTLIDTLIILLVINIKTLIIKGEVKKSH